MNFRGGTKIENPGFQIAPMIDVMFILLSFFIASQIFSQWETEIDIKLPTAQTGKTPERLPGEIIINVLKDGRVIVNGKEYVDDALMSLLDSIVEMWPGQSILIRADEQTNYGHVIRVLDQCRQADIWNISFATVTED